MKFSIVIPVYNVEKYIDRCLNSVLKQSYKDYEVIIVDDESPDNSIEIINKYVNIDDRFKVYSKKNGGLSDARNFGVKKTSGDYLIFLDSDDYIEKDLLFNLNEVVSNYDMVKFHPNIVDDDGILIRKEKALDKSKEISIEELSSFEFFEPAWSYAYKSQFWKGNNFEYAVGRIHEDYGLTPLCIAKANNIYYLNYCGYNYVQREGSITHGSIKAKKRADDMIYHFKNLIDKIEQCEMDNKNRKIIYSVIANGVICSAKLLSDADKEEHIKKLKEMQIYKYLMNDTFSRKVKRMLVKLNMKLYLDLFIRNK